MSDLLIETSLWLGRHLFVITYGMLICMIGSSPNSLKCQGNVDKLTK